MKYIILAIAFGMLTACASSPDKKEGVDKERGLKPMAGDIGVDDPKASDEPDTTDPGTPSDSGSDDKCVEECVAQNQMRAVSPDMIKSDCETSCANDSDQGDQ